MRCITFILFLSCTVRDQWAVDAGHSKYADMQTSYAYGWLKESPLGKVDGLGPIIEMAKSRPALLDGTHAGDYGFDPMGYANTEEVRNILIY